VSRRPKVLVFGGTADKSDAIASGLAQNCEVVVIESLAEAIRSLDDLEHVDGVCVLGEGQFHAPFLLECGGLLQQIRSGVALLDVQSRILWCNQRLRELGTDEELIGREFLDSFVDAEILGPDFCPVHTALGSGTSAQTTVRIGELHYVQIEVTPVTSQGSPLPQYLIAMVRDVSREVIQRQKLNSIYQAGLELGDLQPGEVFEMSVEERVELLKSKILLYTQDVLEFDTVEIRLLERSTGILKPLLEVGMKPDAAGRNLLALAEDNGVTGFVAATGRSYLCEDTTNDKLYLPGAPDARSSLTVPLVLHDEVLGTFNVESPRPGAFSDDDLQFLELFCREVAIALNTLNLLVAEKATTTAASTERILCDIATPVDEILNDAAWVLEKYIGHDGGVAERLQKILQHTREIRASIQHAGEAVHPDLTGIGLQQEHGHPKLRAKRILVADSDQDVRQAAHQLLGRYGCVVETAHNGEETLLMVRTFHYDTVIADIRLPDMNGAECFHRIRETHEHLPVILMTGFGYDPTHSIVKARQMGLQSVLYKPFRLDQLITAVESSVHDGNGDGQTRPVSA